MSHVFNNEDLLTLSERSTQLSGVLQAISRTLDTIVDRLNQNKVGSLGRQSKKLERLLMEYKLRGANLSLSLLALPARIETLRDWRAFRSSDVFFLGLVYGFRQAYGRTAVLALRIQQKAVERIHERNAALTSAIDSKLGKLREIGERLNSFKNPSWWAWILRVIKAVGFAISAAAAYRLEQFEDFTRGLADAAEEVVKIGLPPLVLPRSIRALSFA